MKKVLFCLAGASMLTMSSCMKDGTEEVTFSFPAFTVNIISSEEDGSALATAGSYLFDLNLTNQDGSVESSDLIFNNTNLKFKTDVQTYPSMTNTIYFGNIKGMASNSMLEVGNGSIMAIYPVAIDTQEPIPGYYYTSNDAGEYTYTISPNQNFNWEAVGMFYVGDYRVNTFPANTFFRGTTTTEYPNREGGTETYNTEKITYRFILDKELKTATMLMYNAKFSAVEQEPEKAVILVEGLSVEFTADGITMNGDGIIPKMLEAGQYTAVDRFVFNNLEFRTTNDYYTQAEINFTVAGTYKGHFEGTYLNSQYFK